MSSRTIICRSLRQIINRRDTDYSQYFTITEFNNHQVCFKFVSIFKSLDSASSRNRSAVCHTRACLQLPLSRILYLDGITYEQTSICRQLFAAVVGSRSMKRTEKYIVAYGTFLHKILIFHVDYQTFYSKYFYHS